MEAAVGKRRGGGDAECEGGGKRRGEKGSGGVRGGRSHGVHLRLLSGGRDNVAVPVVSDRCYAAAPAPSLPSLTQDASSGLRVWLPPVAFPEGVPHYGPTVGVFYRCRPRASRTCRVHSRTWSPARPIPPAQATGTRLHARAKVGIARHTLESVLYHPELCLWGCGAPPCPTFTTCGKSRSPDPGHPRARPP